MPGVKSFKIIRDGLARDRPEPPDRRKPSWLRIGLIPAAVSSELKGMLQRTRLHTVCEEAKCPNIGECWDRRTMTIMILGGVCTRVCQFCSVDTGNPKGWLDRDEPANVASAVAELGLRYVVLTSVDRDDIPDGGAAHFGNVVQAIKSADPAIRVETLTPDFRGDMAAVDTVLASGPDVFAHNLETVRRLTPSVRDPRATYDQSLAVLRHAAAASPALVKSSLMLGLGETDDEIQAAMDDLVAAGATILTLGQYLRPTRRHLPVDRYVTPEQFEAYGKLGFATGFREVFSGPLVRSSYRAEQVFLDSSKA
jgi:lipoic acid synthetase